MRMAELALEFDMADDLVKRLLSASIYKPHEAERLCEEAADRIYALEKALQMAVEMRALQKTYFKERTKEALIASKQAESSFDRAALETE